MSRDASAKQTTATAAQYAANRRDVSNLRAAPTMPAAIPVAPTKPMTGARARRYTADRSIKVRMTCRFSEAQSFCMRRLCNTKYLRVKFILIADVATYKFTVGGV